MRGKRRKKRSQGVVDDAKMEKKKMGGIGEGKGNKNGRWAREKGTSTEVQRTRYLLVSTSSTSHLERYSSTLRHQQAQQPAGAVQNSPGQGSPVPFINPRALEALPTGLTPTHASSSTGGHPLRRSQFRQTLAIPQEHVGVPACGLRLGCPMLTDGILREKRPTAARGPEEEGGGR